MISLERIGELRSEVGEDDFAEIAELFLSETDSLVGDLAHVPDMAAAETLLHSLKGSALNLGFVQLAELCREGRAAGLTCDAWAERVDRIRAVYEESKARLAALG